MSQLFARITKADEAKRLVFGRIAEEVVDRSGEIFDYASSKPYFQTWSQEVQKDSGGKSLGNVRAMHGKVAAGTVQDMLFDDSARAIDVVTKVVDDAEWKKVMEGVYTGFSIGGSYVRKWDDSVNGETVKRYTAAPNEVSLVDRPCMPTATFFDVQKADGTTGKVDFLQKTSAAEEKKEGEGFVTEEEGEKKGSDDAKAGAAHKEPDGDEKKPAGEGDGDGDEGGKSTKPPAKKADAAEDEFFEVQGTDEDLEKLATAMRDHKLSLPEVVKMVLESVEVRDALANELTQSEAGAIPPTVAKRAYQSLETFLVSAGVESDSALGTLVKGCLQLVASAIPEEGAAVMQKADFGARAESTFTEEAYADLEKALLAFRPKKEAPVHIEQQIDIQKMVDSALEKAMAPVLEKNAALEKEVELLKSQPAPARIFLKAVSKEGDAEELDKGASQGPQVRPVMKNDGTVDDVATAIKKAHLSGGVKLNKFI